MKKNKRGRSSSQLRQIADIAEDLDVANVNKTLAMTDSVNQNKDVKRRKVKSMKESKKRG